MPVKPKTHQPRDARPEREVRQRLSDEQRGSRHERGYTHEWSVASREFLRAHPLCRHCYQAGRRVAATVTDHVIPHRGDMLKFWGAENWQPLCKRCHDRKTARGG